MSRKRRFPVAALSLFQSSVQINEPGRKKENTTLMPHEIFDLKITPRSPFGRGFLLIPVLLVCFALSPGAQAVVPPPDGGYPGSNTAEGTQALQSLTTGVFGIQPLVSKRSLAIRLAVVIRRRVFGRSSAMSAGVTTRPREFIPSASIPAGSTTRPLVGQRSVRTPRAPTTQGSV
jgi:hypothetical protein